MYDYEELFSFKRDKPKFKKIVCNANARFVDQDLEKSSSYIFGSPLQLYTGEETFSFKHGL